MQKSFFLSGIWCLGFNHICDSISCVAANPSYYWLNSYKISYLTLSAKGGSTMRRKEREITDTHQLQQILEECKVCRVAMQDKDGLYLVPLNFGYQYQDGKLTLYLHSSKEGRKISALSQNSSVCFEMDCSHKLVEGDVACGQTAVKILNAWAETCKGLVRVKSLANDRTYDANGEIADPNEYLISINVHQMANAAEIMRTDETLFTKAQLSAFQTMMKNVFYPAASDFLAHKEACKQHSWLNWDLAQMTSILSIGILCDDQDKINEAILYFKYGVGNGSIDNAVPFLHQDPDGHGVLGQGQESGRDQGHATLCIALMGAFCQMAYNIGEDLFAYQDNKVLAMAEYTAKYNLWKDFDDRSSTSNEKFVYSKEGFPYSFYENCSWQCPALSSKEENDKSRGEIRPCWALIYYHYKTKGIEAYYTKKFMDGMGVEGGGGHYGSTSGGFDQLGFGTLMYTKE